MAYSTCPKCSSTYFEVRESEPRNSTYKLVFVQCSSCGAVVGTMPYYDAGILAKQNQNQLTEIEQQIKNLGHVLSRIQQHLQAY